MNRMQDQTEVARTALGGGASVGNNYLLDGFPITDIQNRPSAMPSIEMLEDVKVQVHTYDSEMGRTGGGVFNATAKSGTSTLHGSAFGLIRPNGVDREQLLLEGSRSSEAGAVLAQLRRLVRRDRSFDDKTFFWVAAEGYRDGLTQNGNWHLPTEAERNGDFSQLTDSSGRRILIYDPLTTEANGNRLAFPGNNINQRYDAPTGQWVPANRINPVGCEYSQAAAVTQCESDRGRRAAELRHPEHTEQSRLSVQRRRSSGISTPACRSLASTCSSTPRSLVSAGFPARTPGAPRTTGRSTSAC